MKTGNLNFPQDPKLCAGFSIIHSHPLCTFYSIYMYYILSFSTPLHGTVGSTPASQHSLAGKLQVQGSILHRCHILSLSLRSPLICRVDYVCGPFSAPFLSLFFFFLSRSSRLLQQLQSVLKGAHFCSFLTNFLPSCVGALSSIITGHRGLLFFEE